MKKLILAILTVVALGTPTQAESIPETFLNKTEEPATVPSLTEDEDDIKYVKKKPAKGSPQDLTIQLVLAREMEDAGTIDKLVSSKVSGWFLKALKENKNKDNPMVLKSLQYRLAYSKPKGKWVVHYSYSRKNNSLACGCRYPVWEDNQWKIE